MKSGAMPTELAREAAADEVITTELDHENRKAANESADVPIVPDDVRPEAEGGVSEDGRGFVAAGKGCQRPASEEPTTCGAGVPQRGEDQGEPTQDNALTRAAGGMKR